MRILLLLFIGWVLGSCSKDGIARNTPSCVEEKIKSFEKEACESNADVKKYEFQDKTVYVFNPGTCGNDMTSEVVNESCGTLGFLGGISGNYTINGEEFTSAKFKKTIWKN
jgi:hypothetical protein